MDDMALDARNMRLVGHTELNSCGDCMLVNVDDGIAYVGHMGQSPMATSIVDVSDPSRPTILDQLVRPFGTHSHKVQLVDDILLVNRERNKWGAEGLPDVWSAGLAVYDVSKRDEPKPIGFWRTKGTGVHRMTYWEAPYAYVTASDEGFEDDILVILDLSDPTDPTEVGRWWFPGMNTGAGETPTWESGPEHRCGLHHALVRGDRAYCGWRDLGLVILDVSRKQAPQLVSHLDFGADVSNRTHTALPLPNRDVVVVTDEAVKDRCQEIPKQVRLVDVEDEKNPRVRSLLPVPQGDYCDRGGRFGPHNLHEMRPGSFTSSDTIFLTYFNAGVRAYDVSDVDNPVETGHYVPIAPEGQPATQLNDIHVESDGLVYVTDRYHGGLYIVEYQD